MSLSQVFDQHRLDCIAKYLNTGGMFLSASTLLVYRIENTKSSTAYTQRKRALGLPPVPGLALLPAQQQFQKGMGTVLDGPNEHYLLHGTSYDGALGIAKENFNFMYSKNMSLGRGFYLSDDPSTARQYLKSNRRAFVICRVLLANCTSAVGSIETAMHSGYDSLLSGRQFVVPSPELVLPEYLVVLD